MYIFCWEPFNLFANKLGKLCFYCLSFWALYMLVILFLCCGVCMRVCECVEHFTHYMYASLHCDNYSLCYLIFHSTWSHLTIFVCITLATGIVQKVLVYINVWKNFITFLQKFQTLKSYIKFFDPFWFVLNMMRLLWFRV